MPNKRKSGKWANDTIALRRESQAVLKTTKRVLSETKDPAQRAAAKSIFEVAEKFERAMTGDVEALIELGVSFLGQKE